MRICTLDHGKSYLYSHYSNLFEEMRGVPLLPHCLSPPYRENQVIGHFGKNMYGRNIHDILCSAGTNELFLF